MLPQIFILFFLTCGALSLSLSLSSQGDTSDSDAGKKRKKKYRLEVHHQQVFADSADDVS